jgi:hypothetical protein
MNMMMALLAENILEFFLTFVFFFVKRSLVITIGETVGGITKFVVKPSVSPEVIVVIYHLPPTSESLVSLKLSFFLSVIKYFSPRTYTIILKSY